MILTLVITALKNLVNEVNFIAVAAKNHVGRG